MPERLYIFRDPRDVASLDFPERAAVVDGVLRLRPLDMNGLRYDRFGKRQQVIAVLPELRAEGITELYGFHAEYEENGGSIDFQLSNDGGATFMRFDGLAWVVDGQYSTRDQVDQGLPTFPIPSPRRLLLRARLAPAPGGRSGPELQQVSLFYELSYQFGEDLLRSLKKYLEANYRFAGLAKASLVAASSVAIEPPAVPFAPVIAYNLTDDPGRQINVAAGVAGQDVVLAAPQTGEVEVLFRAGVPVFISAEDSLFESTIPSVVVEVASISEDRTKRHGDRKVDWHRTAKTTRLRLHPVWEDAIIRIVCQSPLKREAEAMVEALATVLQYERVFDAEASGESFTVRGFSPVTTGDVVGEGLYVKEAALQLNGRHWLSSKFEDVPVAEEIDFGTEFMLGPSRTGEPFKVP